MMQSRAVSLFAAGPPFLPAPPHDASRFAARTPGLTERPDAALLTMDALSELLRVVKLNGALFFDAQCSAPWCFSSPPSNTLASFIDPRSQSTSSSSTLIAEGAGYIRVGSETTPLRGRRHRR